MHYACRLCLISVTNKKMDPSIYSQGGIHFISFPSIGFGIYCASTTRTSNHNFSIKIVSELKIVFIHINPFLQKPLLSPPASCLLSCLSSLLSQNGNSQAYSHYQKVFLSTIPQDLIKNTFRFCPHLSLNRHIRERLRHKPHPNQK